MQHALVLKGGQPHLSLFLNLGSKEIVVNLIKSNHVKLKSHSMTVNSRNTKRFPFVIIFLI